MNDTETRPDVGALHLDRQDSAYIKGWAMLFMLIHHLFAEDTLLLMTPLLPRFCWLIGQVCQVCVAMFVFAAGFGMYRSGDTPLRTLRRIPRLYLRMWAVMLLFTIPVMLLTGVFRFDLVELIKNALAVNTSYNSAWWFVFLYAKLMLIQTVLLLLPDSGKGSTHLILFLLSAAAAVVTYLLTPFTGGLINFAFSQLSEACFYFTVLLMGRYAAQHELLERLLALLCRRGRLRMALWAILMTVSAVLLWMLMYVCGIDRLFINWFTVPLAVTAVLLVRYAVTAAPLRRAVVRYGQASGWTWLVHMTFIEYLPGITFFLRLPIPTLLWIMLLNLAPALLLTLLWRLPEGSHHKRNHEHT